MAFPTTHDLGGGTDNAILMEIELPIPFHNSNHNNIECCSLGFAKPLYFNLQHKCQ